MAMTSAEAVDLLTVLANLDPHHSTQSQEKLAKKAAAWLLVLDDVEYPYALQAMKTHYRDPNAKSLTPAMLRLMALKAVPQPIEEHLSPADADARERACNAKGCPCPHTKCWNGYLDEETTRLTQHGSYPAVRRCPTCREAKMTEVG